MHIMHIKHEYSSAVFLPSAHNANGENNEIIDHLRDDPHKSKVEIGQIRAHFKDKCSKQFFDKSFRKMFHFCFVLQSRMALIVN